MPRLHLVRHGQAAAGWYAEADPGLSALGREQAEAVATSFDGPLPIVTSPLRRCLETAGPLAARWGIEPVIEPRVAEVLTPEGMSLDERGSWLSDLMAGEWPPSGPLRDWCDDVVAALAVQPVDAVVFTHFVAINVVIGRATGDRRVLCTQAGNCSVTVVDVDRSGVTLVSAPVETASEVL